MLVAMAGLPGTGKSALAYRLAEGLSGVVLNKDHARSCLFPERYVEYSSAQDDLCVTILLDVAAYLLTREPTLFVFLDGRTFSRRTQVEHVAEFARGIGEPLEFIECVCSDETARLRLEADQAQGAHPAENRSYELYLEVKARWEPIMAPRFVVDTDAPLETCTTLCLAHLRSFGG